MHPKPPPVQTIVEALVDVVGALCSWSLCVVVSPKHAAQSMRVLVLHAPPAICLGCLSTLRLGRQGFECGLDNKMKSTLHN